MTDAVTDSKAKAPAADGKADPPDHSKDTAGKGSTDGQDKGSHPADSPASTQLQPHAGPEALAEQKKLAAKGPLIRKRW